MTEQHNTHNEPAHGNPDEPIPGNPDEPLLDADSTNPDECVEKPFPLKRERPEKIFRVAVARSVLNEIKEHARSEPDAEICGVLVGNVYRDRNRPYLHVEAGIRGEHATNEASGVTFTAETWTHVQEVLEKEYPGKRIVGWYHSHPDFGIFLSDLDLFIHRNFFNFPWQVAHVFDPVREEEGLFVWRDGEPVKEDFFIDEDVEPAEGEPAEEDVRLVEDKAAKNALPAALEEVTSLRRMVRTLTLGLCVTLIVAAVWPIALLWWLAPEKFERFGPDANIEQPARHTNPGPPKDSRKDSKKAPKKEKDEPAAEESKSGDAE